MNRITFHLFTAIFCLLGFTTMAQNATKSPLVTIDTAQVFKTGAYINFTMNDSTYAYYAFKTTPAEYDSLVSNQVDLYQLFHSLFNEDDYLDTYGTLSLCHSDTMLYFGHMLPNSTMRLVTLALESDSDQVGVVNTFDVLTDYSGGEGLATVSYNIYQITSSGFRIDISADSNCSYWYFNILDADDVADSNWTAMDVLSRLRSYTPSTGTAYLGWQNDVAGNEVIIYIFPFNANHELGTCVEQHVIVGQPVGLQSADELSLQVYPNPTTTFLNLSGTEMRSIELFNISGQRVLAQTVSGNQQRLDLSTLSRGTYILKVLTAHGIDTQRIVVD